METRIARADFEDDRRVIVISNIHGYLGFLKRVLKKVNYAPYKDILVINGNMIEKGPHSLQTLRYISQLSDDGDVYLVMGNAEAIQLLFLADDSYLGDDKIFRYIVSRRITGRSCLLSEMFYEMNAPVESARDIQRYKAELKRKYMPEIMFLNSMPTILETKNLIFVHGGIPSEDLESFEKVDAMQFLKRDAYLEHCKYEFSKYVITGGWPSHLYNSKIQSQKPIIDRQRKIVSIAGGAGYKFDGQVNALIINDPVRGNFGYAYEDGFQEAIALTPQKASTDSINIRKTSNFVRILEPGAEFSYILHRASGRKLYIYNRYLHSDDEFTTCEDYTDYQLEIKPGDKISVLFETSKGYLIKKNGVTGWYQGNINLLPREEIITRDELLSMHQGTQIIVDDASPRYNEDLKNEQITTENSEDPEIDIPLDIVTKKEQATEEEQKEEIVKATITSEEENQVDNSSEDDKDNNIKLSNDEDEIDSTSENEPSIDDTNDDVNVESPNDESNDDDSNSENIDESSNEDITKPEDVEESNEESNNVDDTQSNDSIHEQTQVEQNNEESLIDEPTNDDALEMKQELQTLDFSNEGDVQEQEQNDIQLTNELNELDFSNDENEENQGEEFDIEELDETSLSTEDDSNNESTEIESDKEVEEIEDTSKSFELGLTNQILKINPAPVSIEEKEIEYKGFFKKKKKKKNKNKYRH